MFGLWGRGGSSQEGGNIFLALPIQNIALRVATKLALVVSKSKAERGLGGVYKEIGLYKYVFALFVFSHGII